MRNLMGLALLTLMACNNPAQDSEPPVSVADSLQQLVIDGHDVAMAKMFTIQRQQKQLQARLDSLKKISGSAAKDAVLATEEILNHLNEADAAMQHWMSGFQYDTLKDNPGAREQYLSEQLRTVGQMKDQVLSSVGRADSLLALDTLAH